jgi:hypothetical protein
MAMGLSTHRYFFLTSNFCIFDHMESILIHPESAEQLKTVKAFLKALNVKFEPRSNTFPQHVAAGIEESIKQHQNGQTISLKEFKEKYLSKK